MDPPLLTSANNPVAKEFREAASGRSGEFILLEGRHLLEEALSVGWPLGMVLLDRELWGEWSERLEPCARDRRVYLASRDLLKKVGTTAGPGGVLALGHRRSWSWPEPGPGELYLFLDAVQDPANVGILVRSAKAFGLSGVFRGEGTADPYKPTALSRSAGAALHMPAFPCTAKQFLDWAKEKGVALLGADASGMPSNQIPPPRGPLVLLLGNEGRGLSLDLLTVCDGLVSIPMVDGWDSVNVAVAGSLLMHAFSPLSRPYTEGGEGCIIRSR